MRLICISPVKWNYLFQRHQQLMLRFRKYFEIFYLEPPQKGFPFLLRKTKFSTNLYVISSYLPFYASRYELLTTLMRKVLLKKIKHVFKLDKSDVLWISDVYSSVGVEVFEKSGVKVYDCCDLHEGFKKGIKGAVRKHETRLLSKVDFVFASSYFLYERLKYKHKEVKYLSNGVDYNFFADFPAKISKPGYIVFSGAIFEWVNIELILKLKEKGVMVELLGDARKHIKNYLLERELNVKKVSYKLLSMYLNSAKAGIIPFFNIPLTRAANPIKAYEYLACGKKIICTDFLKEPQLLEVANIAKNDNEFIEIAQTIYSSPPGYSYVKKARDIAKEYDWNLLANIALNSIMEI